VSCNEGEYKHFKVTYVDEDKDNCIIENDQGLLEAWSFVQKKNHILKLTVELDSPHQINQELEKDQILSPIVAAIKGNVNETKKLEFSEKEALLKKRR